MMIVLYCISKLKVCCQYALKVADCETEEAQSTAVNELIKMHLRFLNLIDAINSIFEVSNFGQLLSTLGFIVLLSFRARFGIDYCLVFLFISLMLQLFVYCYLSEWVVTLVKYILFFIT